MPTNARWARDPKLARFDRVAVPLKPLPPEMLLGLTVPSWRAVVGCVVALAAAILVASVLVGMVR